MLYKIKSVYKVYYSFVHTFYFIYVRESYYMCVYIKQYILVLYLFGIYSTCVIVDMYNCVQV